MKELKLAHGLDVSHPVHTGMVYMADRLAEISDGQMTIKIYPSGQLGNERECLELLQIGSLSLTKVSAAIVENFAPKFRVLGLPYLFESKEHMFSVLDGPIGEGLLEEGEKYRFRGLCYYDAGSRSFYTKDRPVQTPDDLSGLKIRVMKSNTAMNMVSQLGGSPTPISFGELYTALQQGVVDGAENNPPSFYSSRHYEVCKYYSLDEHTSVPDVLLVSLEWWNNMTPQEQQWLKQAALESVPFQRKEWEKSVKESLAAVEEAGVEIIRPDKSRFSSMVGPIYDSYKDQTELYELILKIKEQAQ
ncbi:TRAP transporter substrate-binding protein [Marinoscillum sp.]|uniref:TRAP transporter substrate-binding protein n=1 Tax=Marinoscillum sp. TaxID=2024838 RepID=UPI003BAD7E51